LVGALARSWRWPILIGWFDGFEMFAAWCELRQAFRHFRVDRLVEVALLEERPDRPRRTLLAEYRLLEPDIDL